MKKDLNKHIFFKEDIQMSNKYMKRRSISIGICKSNHNELSPTPVRISITKK